MSDTNDTPEDVQTAEAFDHLAGECFIHGRRADAVEYYRRALAVRERALGPDHHDVANSLIVLAGVIGWNESDHPEVESLNRRAADIYERAVGLLNDERGETFKHVFHGLLGVLGNLAGIAQRRGDLEAAETGYREIQHRFTSLYGQDKGYIHPTLPGFTRLLVQRGKASEAESLLRATLARAEGSDVTDDWGVADCEEALAELCAGQGRRAEAESLYRAAIARREQIAKDGWPASAGTAAHTLRKLAGLYRETARTGEAGGLERRAEEWTRRRAEALPWENELGNE